MCTRLIDVSLIKTRDFQLVRDERVRGRGGGGGARSIVSWMTIGTAVTTLDGTVEQSWCSVV